MVYKDYSLLKDFSDILNVISKKALDRNEGPHDMSILITFGNCSEKKKSGNVHLFAG